MLLAIDCGNTRTKWAIFNDCGEMIHHDACLNAAFNSADLFPSQLSYKHIVISNVAGEQHAAALIKKLAAFNLPTHWVKVTDQAGDVLNRYLVPDTLGSDRWAALIAAWHIKHAPCIVVNAGTAVTIDGLSTCKIKQKQCGEFIGGVILPGLHLMQQSLGLATAQLPKTHTSQQAILETHQDIFAKTTADAIRTGALLATAGAIKQMIAGLERHCQQEPSIIISGGNGHAIKNYLAREVTNQVLIVDNLVLQGLYLIEKLKQNQNMIKSEAQ